jgi:hypothetical protein
MTEPHETGQTLAAGLLVQYLHGELDAQQETGVSEHLAVCQPCRTLVESLQVRMRAASDVLRLSAFEAPGTVEWQRLLESVRAAAPARQKAARLRLAAGWIIGLGTVAGLSSSPVRAWMAERWTNLIQDAPAPGQLQHDGQATGQAGLIFEPERDRLDIAFQTTQPGGTLIVRYTDATTVSVTVTGGHTEQLAWRRGSVRIVNQPDARASYLVTLPRSVERVSIRVGGLDRIDLARRELGDSLVIGLQHGAVRKPEHHDES